MKALIAAAAGCLCLSLPAFAGPTKPDAGDNADLVVRVAVGDGSAGSGVVVSVKGHILTSSVLIDACETCPITVSDDRDGRGSAKAVLVAVDYPAGLAVIKTDRTFTRAAVLEHLPFTSAEDGLAIIGVHRHDGKTRIDTRLIDGPDLLAAYPGAPGMLGAAAFNGRTGRLTGIIMHGQPATIDGERTLAALLASPDAIRSFLSGHGIPFTDAKPPRKRLP